MATGFEQSDVCDQAMTADSATVADQVADLDPSIALSVTTKPAVPASAVAGNHATVVAGHPPTVAAPARTAFTSGVSHGNSKRSMKRARRRLRCARKDHAQDCY